MTEVFNSGKIDLQMNHKDKPSHRRRRVCFSTEADDICYLRDVAPASTMTNEEKGSAWYTYEDMIQMKKEAKKVAQRFSLLVSKKASATPPLSDDDGTQTRKNNLKRRLNEDYPLDFAASSSATIEEGINETYRGLELRIFLGRQVKKYFAARKILEYQRKYKIMIAKSVKNGKPNIKLLTEILSKKLGYVSAKCSRWARDKALVTGQSDFKGVYEQSENLIPASTFEQFSRFPSKRKQTNEFSSSVAKFEMNSCNKRRIFDSHKPIDSFSIPIDWIRRDILPSVNIF